MKGGFPIMQPLKLLASGLLVVTVLGSCLPTGAATSDESILQQIVNYRGWNRVTPEIIKQIQPGSGLATAAGA